MSGAGAVEVRRVVEEEWRELRELRLRALRSDPVAFGSTWEEEAARPDPFWRERAVRGASSATSSQWVAVENDRRLVGTAVGALVEDRPHIFGMWVEPELRGRGIGGRLLDAALAWLRAASPGRAVLLDVNRKQTRAVVLYEARGFRFTGRSRPLEHTTGEFVDEMERPPRGTRPDPR